MIFYNFCHTSFFFKIIFLFFFDFLKIAWNQEKSDPQEGAIRFEFGWENEEVIAFLKR